MSLYYIPVISISQTKTYIMIFTFSSHTRVRRHTKKFSTNEIKAKFHTKCVQTQGLFLSYRELNSQYVAATNDTKCLYASSWAAHKMIWSFYLQDNAYSLSDLSFFLWIPLEAEFAWWRKCYFRTMFTITVRNGT